MVLVNSRICSPHEPKEAEANVGIRSLDEVGNGSVIEATFTFLDEQVKVLLWNAVIALQMKLDLVPEVLIPLM